MKYLKSIFSFSKNADKSDHGSDEIKLTGEIGRLCLGLPQFKQYRDQYAKMEQKVIDELIIEAANFCVSGDSTEKFGAKCLVKLTRIRDLRSLVSKVESDAKKDVEKKEVANGTQEPA